MTQGAENKNENRTKYEALSKRDLHPFKQVQTIPHGS